MASCDVSDFSDKSDCELDVTEDVEEAKNISPSVSQPRQNKRGVGITCLSVLPAPIRPT